MREACTILGVPLTGQEAENTYRSKSFQRVLRSERNRFFIEIASDPDRTKQTAVGHLLFALEKLSEAGEYKEVAEGLLKLARIEGWTTGEKAEINVFGGLSTQELDNIRKKIQDTENVRPN